MAALGAQSIASSYEQLLHVDRDGGGNSTTHVAIKDGDNGTTFGFTIATDALMMSSTNRLEFGDTGTYIHQSADGVLDLVSDTEIEINATTIDMNGALDLSGNAQLSGTVTVGADGSGTDVIFYSGTAGDNFTWDASEEKLTITGTNGQTALDVADGNLVVADNIDLEGDIDVNGVSNLDVVDIDGAVQIDNTVTVGADDQGYDVIFYGDTASSNMTWDTSADELVLNDSRLVIDQDDDDMSISIDSAATSADIINISAGAVTTGIVIDVPDANALTTGSIINLYSGSSDNSTRNLIKIHNDHSSADNTVGLFIQQDGADASIELGGNGSIKFPGTQGASSDANSLDDYEEGTWTPTIFNATSGGTQVGSATAVGRYVKIGQQVHLQGYFVANALNVSGGNFLYLRGLPFNSHSTSNLYSAGVVGHGSGLAITAGHHMAMVINHNGASDIQLNIWDATTGISQMTGDELSADGGFIFQITYSTD